MNSKIIFCKIENSYKINPLETMSREKMSGPPSRNGNEVVVIITKFNHI